MARSYRTQGGWEFASVVIQCLVRAAAILIAVAAIADNVLAQGVFLPSIGPINQSIGGAAVAAPIDSSGALAWNPAAISGLKSNEMQFGVGLVMPQAQLSSTLDPGSILGVLPTTTLTGSNKSNSGSTPVPAISLVHHVGDTGVSFGIGVFAVGGFGVNYPSSTTNPVLLPQPAGLGRVFSQASIVQIIPTASYAVTDKLSIGVAPVVDMAQLSADPLFLAPPNAGIYGPGNGTLMSWGGGFQTGVYYITDHNWHFGASYKSQQWIEPFRYNSNNAAGFPVSASTQFNLPSITSIGAAYNGFNRLLLTGDVRYYDYAGATGFNQSGFNANGAVAGLGWRSVWSVAVGGQYEATRRLTLRTGYTYGDNPIPNSQSMFNVASALIIQNWYSVGGSYRLAQNVAFNIAYSHGFQNHITGPIVNPALGGALPGTSVTSTISADIINAGFSVLY
ncbi:MAG TPA: outer membrane protein transport protein [Pirellulales bacterium]|jgi:long-chain fatty acid transport protein|nr:outer membrane protein transport protein [Pirellulales bacterium]